MKKEDMINEAAERMYILGLLDEKEKSVIRDFIEDQKVYVSRPMNLGEMVGVLYELSEEEKKLVRKIEDEEQILVYHVMRDRTNVGMLYSMLSVSMHEEDWKTERRPLEGAGTDGAHPLAYVWNAGFLKADDGDLTEGFGEWGAITVISGEGGLCQIFPDYEEIL